MARAQRGSLRIVAVRDQDARNAAADLLAAAEAIPEPEAEQRLERLPLLLREDIAQPEADEIAQYLHELGVEARFDPLPKQRRKSRNASSKNKAVKASAARQIVLPAVLFLLAVVVTMWILWPS